MHIFYSEAFIPSSYKTFWHEKLEKFHFFPEIYDYRHVCHDFLQSARHLNLIVRVYSRIHKGLLQYDTSSLIDAFLLKITISGWRKILRGCNSVVTETRCQANAEVDKPLPAPPSTMLQFFFKTQTSLSEVEFQLFW